MEFIINELIGVHPMALVDPEKVTSRRVRKEIQRRVRNHPSPPDYFVEKLSEGVGLIAAAFYPKPVIVRLSDFKSNEYASLLGGTGFEPKEENPMLGFRGASRYAHPAYAAGFALECAALRRVREDMGLPDQSTHHGSVLPPFRGGAAGARCHGEPRPQAGAEWSRDLRHV
jgi:pyruvate, water dikinase